MSILLRKECQPALNSIKLDMLHVDIISKILTIVGECGQPILSISGIKFTSMSPKKEEIEYAVELFEKFLSIHVIKLQDLIRAKLAFKLVKEPDIETYGFKAEHNKGYNKTFASVKLTTAKNTYELDIKNNGIILINPSYTIKEFEEFLPQVKDACKKAELYFNEVEAYQKITDDIQKKQNLLASCNI